MKGLNHSSSMRQDNLIGPPAGLPNVYVVGSAKAGTTALYQYFRRHPQVFVPESLKETNYMAFADGLPPLAGPGDKRYVGNSISSLEEYQQLYGQRSGEWLVADVSPSYLYYPQAAKRISILAPQAKIVMVLRNPIECAFSMYAMMCRDRREPLASFAEAFHRSEQRIAKGWEWAWDYQGAFRLTVAVNRYLTLFPSSQLFVARYEQLRDRPNEFYTDLNCFLGIDQIDVDIANQRVNTAPRRVDLLFQARLGRALYRLGKLAEPFLPSRAARHLRSRLSGPAYVLSAEDHQMLVAHFGSEIEDLSRVLGWDLGDWLSK